MALRKLLTVLVAILIIATISSSFKLYEDKSETVSPQRTAVMPATNAPDNQVNAYDSASFIEGGIAGVKQFFEYSGFANATTGHIVMLLVGLFFIFLAIRFDYEPLLLIPIGIGIIIGNIPFMEGAGLKLGIYEKVV